MKRLITLFVEKTSWVNGFTIAITVFGLVALWGMKRDLHPAFRFNYIEVSASVPGASAEEMERQVTYPLEEALQGLPELEEMRSQTRTGKTQITLKFPQSVKNISEKIETARGRVQTALRDLPEEIRNVSVDELSDSKIFLANIGVTGIDPMKIEHQNFIDLLRNKLHAVQGVIEIDTSLRPLQIYVRFDRGKLAQYGVTLPQISSAVRSELDPQTIGYNSVNGRDWLLEFSREDIKPEQVAAIPLFRNSFGHGLKLGDVAKVSYDFERSDKYHFLLDGKPAVEMTVMKSPETDSITVFKDLQAAMAKIDKPEGVDFKVLYDGPYFIQQQIQVLLSNGFGGLILVMIMLSLAMNWRSSLMTLIGLPISYFGTFLILRLFGLSIDLISMIAMILVVGNLVDDAVIFADRYNQLLAEGFEPKDASVKAARELIVPVTGTISTIICAFLPIVMIDSELSVIFLSIPIVVAASLILSWFETFFILPNHLAHYVKTPPPDRAANFFHWVARGYKKILRHTLRFRYVYGAASLGLLVFSLFTASKMPQNFSIEINAPQVEIFVTFKDEMSFDRVQEVLKPLHAQLGALPKSQLDFMETNLGWVYREGKSYRGPRYATVRLVLDKKETDVASLRQSVFHQTQEIIKNFKAPEVPEIEEITATASERGSGSRRENIASVEIEGRDESAFRLVRDDLIKEIEGKGPIQAYVPPDTRGPMTYQFKPMSDVLRTYQIPRETLAFQVQAQSGSVEIAQTREDGRWLKVWLEPNDLKEPALADLQKLSIQSTSHGELIPLRFLGEWQKVGYSDGIEHKNGSRVLTLDFRFDGKETNEQVVQEHLRKTIEPVAKRNGTLNLRVVDANEADKKGREWTGKIVLAAGVLIYLILALTLRSFTQPLIVGLPIPFALIGVIWALKLHDLPLGLMSMIGLIGTMGVAVNDSIVMVDHINRLWKESGQRTAEVAIEGAASRVRAICLTASCTLVGVFPTAYGIGGESGFTQPLAFAMGWGLSASLLLTLFIIPAMLMVLEDIRKLGARVMSRHKKSLEIELPSSQSEEPKLVDLEREPLSPAGEA